MSFPFFPTLAKAVAAGAAMETGREAVRRRNGLGFAAGDYWDFEGDYDYGNNWDWWFGGGGGDSYTDYDFLMIEGGDQWPSFDPIPLPEMGPAPTTGWWQDFYDLFSPDPDAPTLTIDTVEAGNWPDYRTITGGLDYQSNIWDWLTNLGPGPAQLDPQYGPANDAPLLPGYCPKGTYHPVNDPFACVPFPANDPNAKKQASSQQKAQQAAANAAKKAQQQQDKACPKHPQGLPVWKNPATGKCEVVPQCPQGAKFDSTTKRCLTSAQAKELYGESNWWIWLLIAGGALVVMNSGDSGGSGRRRR